MTLKDGEIVGLFMSTNGRHCTLHKCCGESLLPNDLIRLKEDVIGEGDDTRMVLKAVKVKDGVESCHVGFISQAVLCFTKQKYANHFAQVLEIYQESDDPFKRRKSEKNYGMESFRLLDDVPCHP